MNDRALADVAGRLAQLPDGPVRGLYEGRKYLATKTTCAAERSVKLVAEELGGKDFPEEKMSQFDNKRALEE